MDVRVIEISITLSLNLIFWPLDNKIIIIIDKHNVWIVKLIAYYLFYILSYLILAFCLLL